uniref:CD59 molecule (CD59 blood group) n=1 Tax=Serinus canaria TaxID=9135 RepID=A0A8C9UCT7_SERCA
MQISDSSFFFSFLFLFNAAAVSVLITQCYHCDNSPTLCRTNSTCLTTEDTCLQLKFGKLRTFSCWKTSQCSVNEIADSFLLDNFEFFCCHHDLCNESAITGVNKAAFSIASVMAMLWMLL